MSPTRLEIPPPWTNTSNRVTAWNWNYKSGGDNRVKFSTKNGVIAPANNASLTTLPTPVGIGYGWFGAGVRTGTGNTSVVGTVTVTATTEGAFDGGAFFIPGIDGFVSDRVAENVLVSTASFTVITAVPEPSTAVLLIFGLGGLGIIGRRSRK